MALEDAQYDVAQVTQEMKAVGHLHGGWGRTPRCLGILASPVAADDLRAGVCREPRREGVAASIW